MFIQKTHDKYIWTQHSRHKMRQYRLTESRVKRIIRHPVRVEEGIIEGAIAAMQPSGGKTYSEIWTLYVLTREGGSFANTFSRHDSSTPTADFVNSRTRFPSLRSGPSKPRPPLSRKRIGLTAPRLAGGMKRIKVITAWRYPGKAPERDPVPPDILRELRRLL